MTCWRKKYLQWEISWKLDDFSRTWQQRQTQDLKSSLENWSTHKKNCLHSYRDFIHTALYCLSFTFFQTHIHIDSRLPCKGASVSIGSNLGFLHKDTLTYGQEEIEPPTLWSVDNLLCLLSHSCPEETWFPWSLETQRMHLLISFVEWYQMKQLI